MLHAIAYTALGAIFIIYALDAYFCRQTHPNAPKNVRPRFPLFGHVFGMMQYGSKYYEKVSPGQPEVFALPMFTFKLHIVNSRHLFPVIMRNARTLSFQPFTKIASKVWCDASDAFMEMHEAGHPWISDLYKDSRTALSPGEGLDHQNRMTGESIERELEKLDRVIDGSGSKSMDLYEWTHDMLTVASTDGVYGSSNPYRDPQIAKDFWAWNSSMKKMMARIPKFLMSKEMQARDRVFAAYERYWKSDYSDAAEITKARKHLYDREGVSLADSAGNQASFNIALLPNTIPTAFWSLYEVITRPQLLKEVRAEVEQNAIERKGDEIHLNVSALRTECPLLLSSYQETQRMRSIHANIRQALQDTNIESPTTGAQYFFPKGAYIMMPSGPIHKDRNIWGPTVHEFDAYRFARDSAVTRKGESYAFMPWGSAPHMCPARQFASTEVMLFVALLVLRYEFSGAEGREGALPELRIKTEEMTTIQPPRDRAMLTLRRREGWQGDWKLAFGDSSKRVPLASG